MPIRHPVLPNNLIFSLFSATPNLIGNGSVAKIGALLWNRMHPRMQREGPAGAYATVGRSEAEGRERNNRGPGRSPAAAKLGQRSDRMADSMTEERFPVKPGMTGGRPGRTREAKERSWRKRASDSGMPRERM